MNLSRRRNSRAIVLVMTVIVLAVLIAVGYAVAYTARVNLQAARNAQEILRRELAAESALNYAVALLAEDGQAAEYDALDERWAESDIAVSVGGKEYLISIADEDRKLNVNRAAVQPHDLERDVDLRDALKRAVLRAKGTERGFDAICAWIDPSSGLPRSDGSAKGPVVKVADLQAVPDLGPEVWQSAADKPALDDLLCTHPERIDINTAGADVLESLWNDRGLVQRVMDRRRADPFRDRDEIRRFMESANASSSAMRVLPVLDVKSSFFTILVRSASSEPARALGAFVMREGAIVRVLRTESVE